MRPILSFLCISLLAFLPFAGWAQAKTDSVPAIKPLSGIAVGFDLAPLIIKGFDHNRSGLGFSGRLNLKQKIFAVGEIGFENINDSHTKNFGTSSESSSSSNYSDGRTSYRFDYKSNGSYIKLGLEYNMFNVDEPGNLDNVLVGFRYGYAFQRHESSGYTIGNGYWDDYSSNVGLSSANSHWIELLFGIRTELFHNVFMGWSIRLNRIISQQNSTSLEPAAIPGFGKYSGNIQAGFSYTIEYQIPFSKQNKAVSKP
ncbi:MAG: DUF6048 family protein [Breznakibacter sp.]